MDGNSLIDKLLSYAVNNLYMNELDLAYKKSILGTVLNVKLDREIKLTENADLKPLIKELKAFLLSMGTEEKNLSAAVDYIFGLIMPLPSYVDRSYKIIRENMGAQKAISYLYNLSRTGDFSTALSDNFIKYEAKKTSGIRLARSACPINGTFDADRLNKCRIFLELASKPFVFSIARAAKYPYQGTLVPSDKGSFALNESALEVMLSFAEYFPGFFICADYPTDEELNCDKFFFGKNELPFFKAKPLFSAQNEVYQDVEVSYVDWYMSTVRLASYNKNTLINTAIEIIKKWTDYSAEGKLSGTEKRAADVFASISVDGRYALSLVLSNSKFGEGLDFNDELGELLFEKNYAKASVLGVFTLSENFDKYKNAINSLLTQKRTENADNRYEEDYRLNIFREFASQILNGNGYYKDAEEAERALFDALNDMCVSLLTRLYMFGNDKDNFIDIKRFLSLSDIK